MTPEWWFGYAEMKAPHHDASWYFKFTLVAIVYFNILHLIVHLLATRFIQLYQDMNT